MNKVTGKDIVQAMQRIANLRGSKENRESINNQCKHTKCTKADGFVTTLTLYDQ